MRRANDLLGVHVSWAQGIAVPRWGCYVALALLATSAGCSGDDNASAGTGTAGEGGQGGGAGTGAGSKNAGSGGGGAPGTGGLGGLAGSSGGPAAGGTGGSAGSGGDGGNGGSGGDVSSGGSGGDAGSGGSGGDAGSGGAEDGGPPEAGIEVFPCAINVVENTYNAAGVGCNGIVSCRGVIGYMNNSGVRLTFPTITFSVPDGVTCTKTHSTSKWIISDNGAVSHKCAFSTNPLTPWSVAPGGTFRFGYDLIAGADVPPPNDIGVADPACGQPSEAGVDGAPDVADAGLDVSSDAVSEPADAGPDAQDSAGEEAPGTGDATADTADAVADTADAVDSGQDTTDAPRD